MQRFARYVLVGVSTLCLDLLILVTLTDRFGIVYYLSTGASFLIAVSVNYAVSRYFVFHGTERSWHWGYLYFAGFAVLGAFLTAALVAALVHYTGIYYLYARILVAGIIGIGNYLFNLHVNFKLRKS